MTQAMAENDRRAALDAIIAKVTKIIREKSDQGHFAHSFNGRFSPEIIDYLHTAGYHVTEQKVCKCDDTLEVHWNECKCIKVVVRWNKRCVEA